MNVLWQSENWHRIILIELDGDDSGDAKAVERVDEFDAVDDCISDCMQMGRSSITCGLEKSP